VIPSRVGVRHVPGPGLIAVRAWLPGGVRTEGVPGQALVTGRALTEGTRGRDWRRIADDSEALGASVSSNASQEIHGVSVESRHGHWREALDWAVELATEPSFPEDRCRWVARQAVAELESLGDQPEVRTAWAFLEQLYTPHPRARPMLGDRASLEGLVAADCARFHAGALARGLAVHVAGDVDPEGVREHLAGLGVGSGTLAPAPEPAAPVGQPEERREVALPPGDQAHLYLGCLTVAADHPDRHALELLGIVLGGGAGLTGRMPERVREREGLAYSVQVHTLAGAGLDRGRMAVYVGTSPDTAAQAEVSVREELARLLADGVTDEEVTDARAYLLGRDPFRRETARQWADLLVQAALYGVPEDDPDWHRERLEALDAAAVTEAARRHLPAEGMKTTIGVPART
jgi:zinc protease